MTRSAQRVVGASSSAMHARLEFDVRPRADEERTNEKQDEEAPACPDRGNRCDRMPHFSPL